MKYMQILWNTPDAGGGGGLSAALGLGGAAPPSAPPAPPEPSAAPPSAPAGTPLNDPPANQGPWFAAHPDPQVKALLEAKGNPDPMALATSYYHANKLASGAKDVVPLPAADAPQETWDKYLNTSREAFGVKGPESYEFQFADSVQVDNEFKTFAQKMFHGLAVSPKQAQQAVAQWQEFAAQRMAQEQTQRQQANERDVAALKSQYGANWDSVIARGQTFAKNMDLSPAAAEWLERNGGYAPVLELFAKIGAAQREAPLVGNGQGGGAPGDPNSMTLEQVNAAINQLQGDQGFQQKYADKGHPEHKDAVARMERLFMARAAKQRAA